MGRGAFIGVRRRGGAAYQPAPERADGAVPGDRGGVIIFAGGDGIGRGTGGAGGNGQAGFLQGDEAGIGQSAGEDRGFAAASPGVLYGV
mgnify:CR=1 FL=1